MFWRVNKGLTIIEVLIVLAISTGLAVISIAAFSSRGRTADDDAARQVLANIALVRNQAQQGQGLNATEASGRGVSGTELFGQAVNIIDNQDYIQILTLIKDSNGNITAASSRQEKNPGGLKWNIDGGTDTSASSCSVNFISCYSDSPNQTLGTLYSKSILTTQNNQLTLVFRNRSGDSYAMNNSNYLSPSNYSAAKQGYLRVAIGKPGQSRPADTKAPQYYLNFDLSIPNNQELQVYK